MLFQIPNSSPDRSNAGEKIKSIFELFILQKNEFKSILFSIVQTLDFEINSLFYDLMLVKRLQNEESKPLNRFWCCKK